LSSTFAPKASVGGEILKQIVAYVYLNVIEIQLFKLSVVVFQLLQAGIDVRRVQTFVLVNLEVGVLGDALQEYTQFSRAVKLYRWQKSVKYYG